MGGDTQIIPTQSATQQQTQIPQYLQDAGMAATSKAQEINSTPYKAYGGELVAPLSDTQNKAIDYANGATGAGQDSLATAKNAVGAAGGLAANSVGTGSGATNTAAVLAALTGGKAADSQNAGASDLTAARNDLDAARNYTTKSTAPITGGDIAGYMNPYIRQATDPVADLLTRQSGQNKANIDSKAAMTGSFGGSRTGLVESQNQQDLSNTLSTLYGNAYSSAYTNAQTQASDALQRYANAAGLANNTAGQSINASGQTNTNANDSVSRLANATNSNLAVGKQQSDLATSDVDRLLSLVTPANSTASTASGLSNDALQRLLTTGAVQQTQGQNVDNAAYQQYLNQVNYPTQQLNALIAAAGGVPYGTSSTSNTQGQDVIQTPSILGQVLGAAGAAAGAFSSRDLKENFGAVDDEEVLAKFRRTPVETYNYRSDVRSMVGDDGRTRIGPMSQDFGREFLDDPEANIIPMPEILGGLVSAVRALDRRTAPRQNVRKNASAGVLPRVA